jgi:cellulose biosynthesis protein BcsQ
MNVPLNVATFLAIEVCKDLDYYDIYKLAEKQLQQEFQTNYSYRELMYEYEERYDYVFLDSNNEPSKLV